MQVADTGTTGFFGSIFAIFKWVGSLSLVLFCAIPVAIKTSPWVARHVVFVNHVRWPPMIDFNKTEEFGLNYTRNFQIDHDDNTLGIWHTLPISEQQFYLPWIDYDQKLSSGRPIVIYFHGNTGTRAGHHRIQLYKKLAEMGFHVITLDYRGYGDSTGSPTETGVCSDAMKVFEWVLSHAGSSPIFFWGHSLGTAITAEVCSLLQQQGKYPHGIILEAPFNNLRDAASNHPFTFPFRYLPGFNWLFLDALSENGIYFQSDINLRKVRSPLLILHAKDDFIVPYMLGEKLYHEVLRHREGTSSVTSFVPFDESLGYGHKHIYRAPDLENIVGKFVRDSTGQTDGDERYLMV